MPAPAISDLLDELIESWSARQLSQSHYIQELAPAIVQRGGTALGLPFPEVLVISDLRRQLSESEWQRLPELLDERVTILRYERIRRDGGTTEHPIDGLQFSEAERRRRQDLSDRIMALLESDFLNAPEAFLRDADQELLGQEYFDWMRIQFVKEWALRELDLEIDNEQAAAIAATGRSLRVTARAGSGKTRTLVTRAIFLTRHCGVDPRTVLLLAFNRRAASEMRERLEASLSGELPHVMTFHALAHALVRPDETLVADDAAGDSQAQSRAVQDVIDEHVRSHEYAATIQRIMLEHFREDWHAIVAGGFNLERDESLARLRALPRETLRGDYVKSHGERLIANTLFEHGIEYKYERNFPWHGVNYKPDFTIARPAGRNVVIEYFGLRGDPDYDAQAEAKRAFWNEQPDWTLLEYTPSDVGLGAEAFERRLLTDLADLGLRFHRLAEEDIWESVRRRAIDRFTGLVRTFVSRCRKRGLSDEQVGDLIDSHIALTTAEAAFLTVGRSIYGGYLERLANAQEEDFDGLMWRAIERLRAGFTKFARDKGKERGDVARLRHVLIDEFQDFSPMFYELVSGLRMAATNVDFFCVGDDWQAINAFAGSELKYFDFFDSFFEGGVTAELRTNYRSAENIVAAGNAVMAGRGTPASARRVDAGVVWICDLETFEPTAVERSEHGHDDLTPAVLRLVQHFLSIDQDVVLLSRKHSLPWAVKSDREPGATPDALQRFLTGVRAHLPEDVRKRVTISTTHEYKGLEKDAVVVLDATTGSYPLIHPTWSFLRVFGDTPEGLEDAERRVFYVAITRAADSLCIVTEKLRYSPYLRDLQQQCELEFAPWTELAPAPSPDRPQVEIRVFDAYDVKEELLGLGFRWNSREKFWSRSYPTQSFSEQTLVASAWYRGKVQVEVRSDCGTVILQRRPNASGSGPDSVNPGSDVFGDEPGPFYT